MHPLSKIKPKAAICVTSDWDVRHGKNRYRLTPEQPDNVLLALVIAGLFGMLLMFAHVLYGA
jgi:hypothetical protein